MVEINVPRNGRVLLDSLTLTPEMLRILPKVPISSAALQALLRVLASTAPFDAIFYAETYPDVADGLASGVIADARQHFLEHGYLEGRLGAPPDIDEDFYLSTYPDVAAGIANGGVSSVHDHYVRSGAAEGRSANLADKNAQETWRKLAG
jgi:hypothetical protein